MPKQKMVNLLLNVISNKKEKYYEQIGTVPIDATPEIGQEIARDGRTFVVKSMETEGDLVLGIKAMRNTRYIYLEETSPETPTFEEIKAHKKLVNAVRNETLREQMKQIKFRGNQGKPKNG